MPKVVRRKHPEPVSASTQAAAAQTEAKASKVKMTKTKAAKVKEAKAKGLKLIDVKAKDAKTKGRSIKVKGAKAKGADVTPKRAKAKDSGAKTKRTRIKQTKPKSAAELSTQVWSADTIPDLPHMEAEGIALLGEHLTGIRVFLEYGSGGSSLMVAQAGIKSIYSVDTDKQFLKAVRQRLLDEGIPRRRYIPIYADIGATKEWGRPVDESHARDWPAYCTAPWEKLLKTGERPDLVLIDGRFRVASFLITMLMAPPGCVILFDDYVDRPEYHVVERYLQPARLAGRMAEFVVEPVAEPFAALIDLLKYSTESR